MVMGLKNVGKSTVIQQLQKLSSGSFDDRRRKSESFVDFKGQLQFSEATQFPFKGLRKMAIKASESFILVYSVDDEESFDYVTKLLSEIIAIKGNTIYLFLGVFSLTFYYNIHLQTVKSYI
jgi:GTPase SAR1 family protein